MLRLWTKMESCHAKWQVEVQICCRYHLQNPANTMQHEGIYLPYVAVQNWRCYLHNAGWCCRMLNIWQIACKTLLFVSLPFLALIVLPSFILFGFAQLHGRLGLINSNSSSNSKNNTCSSDNKNYFNKSFTKYNNNYNYYYNSYIYNNNNNNNNYYYYYYTTTTTIYYYLLLKLQRLQRLQLQLQQKYHNKR